MYAKCSGSGINTPIPASAITGNYAVTSCSVKWHCQVCGKVLKGTGNYKTFTWTVPQHKPKEA